MEFYPSYGQYEEHHYSRQDFPLLFHYDLYTDPNERYLHWHENLEFLLILTGSCRVQCGLDERIAHVATLWW